MDLGAPVSGRMTRPSRFSPCGHGEAKVFFPSALQRASVALKEADVAAPHLDELDQLTIKEVGGSKTLTMVQRYAHLAPGHLHAAVERLVALRQEGAVEN